MSFLSKLKPFRRCVQLASFLFPRSEEFIVFGSGSGSFADNSKYMFIEMSNADEKRPIWICDDEEIIEELNEKGYEAYQFGSHKTKYFSLRAKYAVVDHINEDLPSWYIQGAELINLWHGFPYKDLRSERNPQSTIENFKQKFRKKMYLPDYFLNTNKQYSFLYGKFNSTKPIYAGYPRNDIFYQEIEGSEIGTIDMEEDFIFYLPTYRDNSELEEEVDLELLDRKLKDLDYNLVLKPHPNTEINQEFENINIIDRNIDIYPLMNKSKALITDYSSVMFDYMHTGKPVIRFQFDKEEYEETRGLNEQVKHLIPGKEVKTLEELKKALDNLKQIDTNYDKKLEEVFEDRDSGNLQFRKILDQLT